MPFIGVQRGSRTSFLRNDVGVIKRSLARVRTALASAVARFSRDTRREQRTIRYARVPRTRYWYPTRVPPMRMGRPVAHPVREPRPVRFGRPRTVLAQRRAIEARLYGRPALAVAVEDNAQRVAGVIRRSLLGLRRGLGALRDRLAAASRLATQATRPRLRAGVR